MAKSKRGGRKPGAWTLLKPTDLIGFREKNKISRARLAGALGVSSTSIQNWETGNAVPTDKSQLADTPLAFVSVDSPRRIQVALRLAF